MNFSSLKITQDMLGKTLLVRGDHYFAEDVFAQRDAQRLRDEAARQGIDLSRGPDIALRSWVMDRVSALRETTVGDLRAEIPETLVAAFGTERDAYSSMKASLRALAHDRALVTDALRAESPVTMPAKPQAGTAAQKPDPAPVAAAPAAPEKPQDDDAAAPGADAARDDSAAAPGADAARDDSVAAPGEAGPVTIPGIDDAEVSGLDGDDGDDDIGDILGRAVGE